MPDLDARIKAAAARPGHELDLDDVRSGAIARRRRGRALVAGAAVVALLLVVGAARLLSGSTEESQQLNVVNVSDLEIPDPLEGVAADSWVRTLALVPNTPSVRSSVTSMADFERMRAEAGIEAPPAGIGDDEVLAYLEALLERGAPAEFLSQPVLPSQMEQEWGISYGQIDQMVRAGMPPENLLVAAGRFDPVQVDEAVRSFPYWADRLEVAEYEGMELFTWGEDYRGISSDPDGQVSPLRPLGIGGRLVVDDQWMSWTDGDAETEATIRARQDPTSSMAVVPWARRAALMADDLGLTRLTLWSAELDSFGDPDNAITVDAPVAIVTGSGVGPEGSTDAVRLAYRTADEAEANLPAIREATELDLGGAAFDISVEESDVVVSGSGLELGEVRLISLRRLYFSGAGSEELTRPVLPEDSPTVEEVMADGLVSVDEYELAFWTYVECAEAAGAEFGPIRRGSDGIISYSLSAGSVEDYEAGSGVGVDECYWTLFGDIDIVMQLSVDQD